MGTLLFPPTVLLENAQAWAGEAPGRRWILVEDGGFRLEDDNLTDAELELLFAGFDPQATPALPPALRGLHASHIRQLAEATQAQLDALTVAEARHMMRDLAKAMVLLVDSRLGD